MQKPLVLPKNRYLLRANQSPTLPLTEQSPSSVEYLVAAPHAHNVSRIKIPSHTIFMVGFEEITYSVFDVCTIMCPAPRVKYLNLTLLGIDDGQVPMSVLDIDWYVDLQGDYRPIHPNIMSTIRTILITVGKIGDSSVDILPCHA